jgi:hypothetical protein
MLEVLGGLVLHNECLGEFESIVWFGGFDREIVRAKAIASQVPKMAAANSHTLVNMTVGDETNAGCEIGEQFDIRLGGD